MKHLHTMLIAGTLAIVPFFISPVCAQTEDVLRPQRPSEMQASANDARSANREPGEHSSWRLGVEFGMGLNSMSRAILQTDVASTSSLDMLRSMYGFSPSMGLFVDGSITGRLGIQMRISFESNYVHGVREGTDSCVQRDSYGNKYLTPMRARAELTQQSTFVAFSPSLRMDVDERNSFNVGASAQFRSSYGPDSLTLFILDDDCQFYYDQSQFATKALTASYFGAVSESRLALEASYTHRVPLGDALYIYGTIRGQYFLTPWAENDTFADPNLANMDRLAFNTGSEPSLHILQIAIGLMWNL